MPPESKKLPAEVPAPTWTCAGCGRRFKVPDAKPAPELCGACRRTSAAIKVPESSADELAAFAAAELGEPHQIHFDSEPAPAAEDPPFDTPRPRRMSAGRRAAHVAEGAAHLFVAVVATAAFVLGVLIGLAVLVAAFRSSALHGIAAILAEGFIVLVCYAHHACRVLREIRDSMRHDDLNAE